jgi:hypothetical protein
VGYRDQNRENRDAPLNQLPQWIHHNKRTPLQHLSHDSHLLRPLDVGCFSALKQAYGRSVEQIMGHGVNHIDAREFLPLYWQARQTALRQNNIQAGFAATGLVPYRPGRMLSQLHAEFRTPLPWCRPPSNASWTAKTPHNIAELQKQTALLMRCLKRRTHSPPSPTEQALGQPIKGCEVAMSSAVLLEHKLSIIGQKEGSRGSGQATATSTTRVQHVWIDRTYSTYVP